jgi:hypothetical protein
MAIPATESRNKSLWRLGSWSIYNIVITARVLPQLFLQAQEVAVLQPVFAITDPYLTHLGGIIPLLSWSRFESVGGLFSLECQ